MERREFLKLTLGLTVAAGAMAAVATTARAALAPLPQGDPTKPVDPHAAPPRSETDTSEHEAAGPAADGDSEFSAQRYWRRRRVFYRRRRVFFRRRRRFWRRRRRMFF